MFSAIKTFPELCRVSNLPTVWTNVLAATILTGTGFSWPVFLTLTISMSLFYSGGMCLNDIMDAHADGTKKPFRPIPSGRVSIKSAYTLTIALFLAALCLLLFVPYQRAIYAGILLLTVIVAYDKFHRVHPLSVILMATCRLMVFIVSAIAVSGTVGLFAAIAGLLQFAYILAISIAARYEKNKEKPFIFPVIPVMLACISLIDGIVLAVFASPVLLTAGIGGAILTMLGQKFIKGD